MNQEITFNNTEFLLQIVTIILVFISFLFAIFLLTIKSKNKIGNRILALYLILRAIDSSANFYHHFIDVPPILEMLRHDIGGFFQKPLLYLFVLSIIYSDFKLKSKHLLHAIPFLISTLVLFPRFYLPELLGKQQTFTSELEINTIYRIAAIQQIGYIIATFYLLYKYKKLLLENYSIFDKSNYKWLFQMNVFISIIFIVATFKNIYKLSPNSNDIYIEKFRLIVLIALLAFTCWLVLKALYAPNIFKGINSKLQLVSNLIGTKNTEENLNVIDQINELKDYMSLNEPFLNPKLTIKELSESLEINTTELSLLINHHLNKNFYEFISDYRIEKAKVILKNPKHKKLTILEILYQVGFNTKSSFNTSFKKHTGLTPTEYRKKHL